MFKGANEKFVNVFVRAFRKSDASGHHIVKFDCRLENCRATTSLILRCLRYHFKSFLVNSLWCHKLQWRHICNKPIFVWRKCTFYRYTDCEKIKSNTL